MNNNKKNGVRPSVFTTTLLLVLVILFLFNFNPNVFKAGAAPGPIFGEGTAGFIARWVNTVFTLTLSLTATPSTGGAPININLQAVVGGTAPGTANYSLWWNCANVGNSVSAALIACPGLPTPTIGTCASNAVGYKCEAVDPSVFASVMHLYSTSGSFRAKGIIERATATPAEGAANITLSNPIPSASNLTVAVNNSAFCTAGPHANVSWTYTDPGGSAQLAYEVLINGGADIDVTPASPATGFNPSNINPEWRIAGTTGTNAGPSSGCNSGNSDANPQSTCQMTWNNPPGAGTYTAWVRVQNGFSQWSPWARMITYVNGANPPASVNRWSTPIHAYPDVSTPFGINPTSPSVDSPVAFTDRTVFGPGSINRSWSWNFGGGVPGTSTLQNPTNTYSAPGSYPIIFTATDDAGSCTATTQTLNIQTAIPEWKEVAPR